MKDITREELLTSKEYWTAKIQMDLFSEVEAYMAAHQMTRSQLAKYLGCTKGYISQLLSGDYDSRISKFVELSLAIGKIPEVSFTDIEQYVTSEDSIYSGAEYITATPDFTPVAGSKFIIGAA